MTPVKVKPDPPNVAGGHRHRPIHGRIDLDPDYEVDDGGEVGRGQRCHEGLASR
jgi:hypothetical protein